jgi:hypothetical protein
LLALPGNGLKSFRHVAGRVGVIGAFPGGLAPAIRAGATPREFNRFGRFAHIARGASSIEAAVPPTGIDFVNSALRRSHC